MKRIHLLAVDGAAETYQPLVAAAAKLGLRIGWLELAADGVEAPADPAALADLVGGPDGAFRRVAVSPERVVSVKRLTGPPVLRDLVREHFLGSTAVLVAGGARLEGAGELPRLVPDGDGWRLDDRRWADSASFARALRGSALGSPAELNPPG